MFEGIASFKLKVINAMPWTRWPISTVIYKLYDENHLKFLAKDKVRPVGETNGRTVYVFKATGEKIIAPQGGEEDVGNNINLVQVGDGEYRFAKLSLDEPSETLVFSLKDDEQAKYVYAEANENAARRFQAVTPWYNHAIVGIIVMGIVIAGMYVISTSNLRSFDGTVGTLVNALNAQTAVLNQTINSVGSGVRPPI